MRIVSVMEKIRLCFGSAGPNIRRTTLIMATLRNENPSFLMAWKDRGVRVSKGGYALYTYYDSTVS